MAGLTDAPDVHRACGREHDTHANAILRELLAGAYPPGVSGQEQRLLLVRVVQIAFRRRRGQGAGTNAGQGRLEEQGVPAAAGLANKLGHQYTS